MGWEDLGVSTVLANGGSLHVPRYRNMLVSAVQDTALRTNTLRDNKGPSVNP